MKRFLENRKSLPDAIFAANDDSAFGCMKALSEEGYKIPEDVSVLGCDDIELSQWYVPALTTICTHIGEQGIDSMRELVNLIGGKSRGTVQWINGQIVERASCRQALTAMK